jgi:hypothetical protein
MTKSRRSPRIINKPVVSYKGMCSPKKRKFSRKTVVKRDFEYTDHLDYLEYIHNNGKSLDDDFFTAEDVADMIREVAISFPAVPLSTPMAPLSSPGVAIHSKNGMVCHYGCCCVGDCGVL